LSHMPALFTFILLIQSLTATYAWASLELLILLPLLLE
jgi:hypothetical protein